MLQMRHLESMRISIAVLLPVLKILQMDGCPEGIFTRKIIAIMVAFLVIKQVG